MSNDITDVLLADEVLDYLGIDYADDKTLKNINSAIKTADLILKGSIGENYPKEDERAKELAKMIVEDLYDNRGLKDTISGNTRKLVDDISWQLRLELRRSNNETV